MEIKTDALLEEVALLALKTRYKEEYQTEDNKLEALGVAIATYCEWSGKPIMEIFMSALEDANYHSKVAIVQEWFDEE